MGCNPSLHKCKKSPIKDQIEPPRMMAQIHPPLFQTLQERENSYTNLKRRDKRLSSARPSISSTLMGGVDFLGTMPYSLILERLQQFHKEVLAKSENFTEIADYIKTILSDIADNFDNSTSKMIKTNNKQYKKYIGKYSQAILFLRTMGFKDCEDYIEIDSNLSVSNIRFKIKQFEHAVNTVKLTKSERSVI